jgi:hypothetical protein
MIRLVCRLAAVFVIVEFMPMLAEAPVARAQAVGDLWDATQQMSMEGMPMKMPAQTMQVCAKKTWTAPPGANRPGCTVSEFSLVGRTATWTATCTGQQSMTGHGEVTRDRDDHYQGTIKFMGEGFAMTIQLEGKLVGDCNNPQ